MGRKTLLPAALVAVIICGGTWWSRPPTDPIYEGKRLSDWLSEDPREDWSRQKLQAMGPAAVKWLAYEVDYGGREIDKSKPRPFDHAPARIRDLVPEKWGGTREQEPGIWSGTAARCLGLMGPAGAAAIPALIRALDAEDEDLVMKSACALHEMGSASWPAILRAMDTAKPNARAQLVGRLNRRLDPSGPGLSEADVASGLALLRKGCRDADWSVRSEMANSVIMDLRENHPKMIFAGAYPLFLELLADPEPIVRARAAATIAYFGNEGASAVPQLMQMLDDPESYLREQAAIALGSVDRVEQRSISRLQAMADERSIGCRRAAKMALDWFEEARTQRPVMP